MFDLVAFALRMGLVQEFVALLPNNSTGILFFWFSGIETSCLKNENQLFSAIGGAFNHLATGTFSSATLAFMSSSATVFSPSVIQDMDARDAMDAMYLMDAIDALHAMDAGIRCMPSIP